MGPLLDLQVSQSASYTQCHPTQGVPNPYSITPTFNLTAIEQTSQPTRPSNGKMTGLDGIVASVDAANSSFVVTGADGLNWDILNGNYVYSKALVWRFKTSCTTAFQGVPSLATLTAGMPVDSDAQLQPDGSLLANRVAVPDTITANRTLFSSLNTEVLSFVPDFVGLTRLQEGLFSDVAFPNGNSGPIYGPVEAPYSIDNAIFQVSGRLNHLASLSFTPSFTADTMVAGQDTLLTSHVTSTQPSPVYAGGNASMLNASPAAAGSVLRFSGLVFNDHGSLKMDCDQILDGVAY